MKKFIQIVLLYFSPLLLWGLVGEVNAQQAQLDSIQNLLVKKNDGDEKELQLLNAIAPLQVNINPDDALNNSEKAIALAQKLKNQSELAVAYNNKGFILLRKSEYADANSFLKKALSINTELKNQNGIADNQTYLAEILRRQGESDSAKIILEKSLLIYQQQKNTNGIANVYYYLGLVYRNLSDTKNMLLFVDKAIALYIQTRNEAGQALAINAKGVYFFQTGDNAMAIKLMGNAAKIDERIGNLYGLASDYGNLGNGYGEITDLPRSIDYTLKAQRIHEQMGNLHMLANNYINIGILYYDLNQFNKALNYTQKGTALFEQLNINNSMYRNGLSYCGLLYSNLNDTHKAFEYLNKSLALNIAAKDEWGLSSCYLPLGIVCFKTNKYDEAIVHLKKALAIDEKIENASGMLWEYLYLGKAIAKASDEVLIKLTINPNQKSKLILDYFQRAIRGGEKNQTKKLLQDTYEELSKYCEAQGNNKLSFEYYKKFIAYKDSIMNTDNSNSISLLQLQYDTEKKEQQITLLTKESKLQQTELQKQSTTRNALIVACALIALLAGVIYNRYRIKQKANTAIEKTLHHLKTTQEQLVEHEKLASLGKFTADVAREIEAPVKQINQLTKLNRTLILNIKKNNSIDEANELKNNLLRIFNYGKEADAVVKKVLTETRKVQG